MRVASARAGVRKQHGLSSLFIGGNTAVASAAVVLPTGCLAGDKILLALTNFSLSASAAAYLTQVRSAGQAANRNETCNVYTYTLVAADITAGQLTGSVFDTAALMVYRNVLTPTTAKASGVANLTTASIASLGAGYVVSFWALGGYFSAASVTVPAPLTDALVVTSNKEALGVGQEVVGGGGSSTTRTATGNPQGGGQVALAVNVIAA